VKKIGTVRTALTEAINSKDKDVGDLTRAVEQAKELGLKDDALVGKATKLVDQVGDLGKRIKQAREKASVSELELLLSTAKEIGLTLNKDVLDAQSDFKKLSIIDSACKDAIDSKKLPDLERAVKKADAANFESDYVLDARQMRDKFQSLDNKLVDAMKTRDSSALSSLLQECSQEQFHSRNVVEADKLNKELNEKCRVCQQDCVIM